VFLQPVLSGAKIRSVNAFCLNDNPVKSSPFSVEVSIVMDLFVVKFFAADDGIIYGIFPLQTIAVAFVNF
jgi:hypothetical protein